MFSINVWKLFVGHQATARRQVRGPFSGYHKAQGLPCESPAALYLLVVASISRETVNFRFVFWLVVSISGRKKG
jgi:hypothetical protein